MGLAFAVNLPQLDALIQDLISNLPKLPAQKLPFATSLLNQYSRKGTLSDKQAPYVAELVALATGQPLPSRSANVGDFAGVVALFKTASAKLKFPKIRLYVNGIGILLTLAGERSKAPGSVNVAGEGRWEDRAWYGRVSPEGTFDPSRTLTPDLSAALVPLLQELATDPLAAVQRYGKLTGHCMFCQKELTDERSKAAGFGEVCAKNYGLHEQWKQAAR